MTKNHYSFHIYNFGCKVNQEEGGAIAALFMSRGWQQQEPADLYIVNTCTVTAIADKKSRQMIRRLRRENPQAVIAVCGCYAQRAAREIEALGVADIIAGVDQRALLPELAEKFLAEKQPLLAVEDISQPHAFRSIAPVSDQRRIRAYLKIEDGCDQFCHYCVIPYVRGPIRSLPPEQALEQAAALIAAGHGELVLTGIHVGAYGSDFGDENALPELIEKICALPGLARLHLGSLEPQHFSPALLRVLAAYPQICSHLHIPLQSGCDTTLAAMGRHYTTAQYKELLDSLRELLPGLAVTSDVIVGYPGESREDFLASCQFCRECEFAALHIFPYSQREGTVAAKLPGQISQEIKAERAAYLAEIAEESRLSFSRSMLGQKMTLLAEEQEEIEGQIYTKGHSANYQLLYIPGIIPPGEIISVEAVALFAQGLLVKANSGEII